MATISPSDSFFSNFVPNISCAMFPTFMSRYNVWHSSNASLSFFASWKKHPSVKFFAETYRLDIYGVSAIALAFSGLHLSFDRWHWLYFDEKFLWCIAYFSERFWPRSLYVRKVLMSFSTKTGKLLNSWNQRAFSRARNNMNFPAVLHQNLQQQFQMIMPLKFPVS